jgi:hypothetical protein
MPLYLIHKSSHYQSITDAPTVSTQCSHKHKHTQAQHNHVQATPTANTSPQPTIQQPNNAHNQNYSTANKPAYKNNPRKSKQKHKSTENIREIEFTNRNNRASAAKKFIDCKHTLDFAEPRILSSEIDSKVISFELKRNINL